MNPSGNNFYKEKIPSGYKAGKVQQFSPEQMDLFKGLFSNVGQNSFLSKIAGGDEQAFSQMEAPALRQFQGLQSQLASQFSGMGMGGRRGSGFNLSANQQASNFAQDLQSKRMELQRQALTDLMGMSESLLGQRPYQNTLQPKQKKEGIDWLGLGGAALGGLGGYFVGGGPGAMAGASMGYGIGSGKGSGGGMDWSSFLKPSGSSGSSGFSSSGGSSSSFGSGGSDYNFLNQMQSGSGYFY